MAPIYFLQVTALLGGSERAFLDFIRGCPPEFRRRIRMIVPEAGPLVEELQREAPEIPVSVHPFPGLFRRGTRKRPHRTLLSAIGALPVLFVFLRGVRASLGPGEKPEFYVNGLKWHYLSLAYQRLFGARLVWHLQDYFPDLWYTRWFLRIIGTTPELVICNSESVRTAFIAAMPPGWTSVRVVTIHNAVDVPRFELVPNIAVAPRGSAEGPLVSMVGMFTPWKGQDVFVEAVALLLKREPTLRARFQLVGDEIYSTNGESGFRERVAARVREYGLGNRIVLRGLIRDIESVYASSDIVVHCSRAPEPFGKVIVEAMAAGCAVIAADAGGVREIVTDEIDGLLSAPGDAGALAEQLRRLCLDENLRARLGAEGRVTARSRFSADRFVEKILAELRAIGFGGDR